MYILIIWLKLYYFYDKLLFVTKNYPPVQICSKKVPPISVPVINALNLIFIKFFLNQS